MYNDREWFCILVKRGEIYFANFDNECAIGSEQKGIRPVLIIQNDVGNKYSPTVIALMITSKNKKKLPTHVEIDGKKYGLNKNSIILAEQVKTIDKERLIRKVGRLDNEKLLEVKNAIKLSLNIRMDLENIFKDW